MLWSTSGYCMDPVDVLLCRRKATPRCNSARRILLCRPAPRALSVRSNSSRSNGTARCLARSWDSAFGSVCFEQRKAMTNGLWVEGSAVDRVDKRLSMPIFTLDLGPAVEILWTVPGMWCGVPIFANSAVPLSLALYSDTALRSTLATNVVLPISALCILYWGLGVWESFYKVTATPDDAMFARGAIRFYSIFATQRKLLNTLTSIATIVGLPHLCAHLASRQGSAPAAHTVLFFCMGWLNMVWSCELLKSAFSRQRPCFCLEDQLRTVPRALTDISEMLRYVQQPSV